MAFCPQCAAEMEYRERVCSHCGYDFPADPTPTARRTGIAYSFLADVALIIGGIVSGLSCVAAVLGCITSLLQQQYLQALVVCPVSFFFSLALLVVFLRIQKL